MKFYALLCLLCLFPLQQSNQKPETVALVFGPDPVRIEKVKTSEAEKLYSELKPKHDKGTLTEQEAKVFAALIYALDRIPPLEDIRARADWEIRRGVRPPLQKPDRGGAN